MNQKVFFISIANKRGRRPKDAIRVEGMTIGIASDKYPTKNDIRAYLENLLEQELRKQHIPIKGSTTPNKRAKRLALRTHYVDLLNCVNLGEYEVRRAK